MERFDFSQGRRLGEGGFGQVMEGRDTLEGRSIACKRISRYVFRWEELRLPGKVAESVRLFLTLWSCSPLNAIICDTG